MQSFIKWLDKNKQEIFKTLFLILFIVFITIFFGQTAFDQGYQKGQLDYQRGIIQWKIEDGQVWHMTSQLE